MFSLPTDFVTSTVAYIGYLFTDLSGLIVIAVGIPLGFYVIKKVIGILPKR